MKNAAERLKKVIEPLNAARSTALQLYVDLQKKVEKMRKKLKCVDF